MSPSFVCPFPPRRNPHVDALPARALDWLEQHLDVTSTGLADQLAVATIHELAAFTAPDLALDDLDLLHRWYLWLFLVDDATDPRRVTTHPDRLAQLHAPMNAVLDGTAPGAAAPPVAHLLADLIDCFRRSARPGDLQRLLDDTRAYLAANLWEAHYRSRRAIPRPSAYSCVRLPAGAAYTAFDLFPILDARYRLGRAERAHPCLTSMADIANWHISYVNDIRGLERELAEDNPANLVIVMREETGGTLLEARRAAVARCDELMASFVETRDAWRAIASPSPAARRYAGMLEGWMSGSIHWHRRSRRYSEATTLMADQSAMPRQTYPNDQEVYSRSFRLEAPSQRVRRYWPARL